MYWHSYYWRSSVSSQSVARSISSSVRWWLFIFSSDSLLEVLLRFDGGNDATSVAAGRASGFGGSTFAHSSLVGTGRMRVEDQHECKMVGMIEKMNSNMVFSPADAESVIVSTSKQTKSNDASFVVAETANNSPCSWDILFVSPSPSVISFSTRRWRMGTLNGGTEMRSGLDSSLIIPPALWWCT